LTERAPKRADSWTISGAAAYHCGDFQAALTAFQNARKLEGKSLGFWDFLVAMVESQLGHKAEARLSFDRAQSWMRNNATNKMHRQLQAQAASLLNLALPATASANQNSPGSAPARP
jgi:hypothetical protein